MQLIEARTFAVSVIVQVNQYIRQQLSQSQQRRL